MYKLDYHDLVSEDYNEAYIRYEFIQDGLGERFAAALRKRSGQISEHPEHYGEKARKGYREVKVEGFPYLIVYRIYKRKKTIFISSIHHEKKHPRKKYRK